MVVRRGRARVREVAAAVAGGHELAARAGLPLVERDLMPQARGGDGPTISSVEIVFYC